MAKYLISSCNRAETNKQRRNSFANYSINCSTFHPLLSPTNYVVMVRQKRRSFRKSCTYKTKGKQPCWKFVSAYAGTRMPHASIQISRTCSPISGKLWHDFIVLQSRLSFADGDELSWTAVQSVYAMGWHRWIRFRFSLIYLNIHEFFRSDFYLKNF